MSATAKFQQKPMGFGAILGFLILTAQYLGVALVILVLIKGTGVLDPIMILGQDLMAWMAKIISTAPPTAP